MNTVIEISKLKAGDQQSPQATSIGERLSNELIIGLIGPVASGVSTAAQALKRQLEDTYQYEVPDIIKVSNFIKEHASKVSIPLVDSPLDKRITSYQTAGNELRKKYKHDVLAKLAIKEISQQRHKDGYTKSSVINGQESVPIPKRRVYIIDSLKHPEECALLREVYGNIFWMVGVFAPDHVRESRMVAMGIVKTAIDPILDRDQGESAEFGQKVRKAFANSDYFIRNDGENRDNVESNVKRFLDVLFNAEIKNPTKEESAMFHAATAASKSACMSRQVGSALIDADGELISVGWNDVPRFGGGLYEESIGESVLDNRCFRWRGNICHNDAEKKLIEDRVVEGLQREMAKKLTSSPITNSKKHVPVTLDESELRSVVRESGIASLIEFSRAIHAEMAAILAVARDKRHSLRDSVMVVTTYPCHNCARHIVASGVKEVIYIEPYEKSLATKLHPDSITEDDRVPDHCVFKQFQGFAPRHILKLFRMKRDRKKDGRLVIVDRRQATPIYQRHLDSFTLYEDKIVNDVAVSLT